MKILEAQSAVLTNYEVYQHLQDQRRVPREPGQGRRRGPPNLETVVTELLQYFEQAPGPLRPPVTYDRGVIAELVRRVRAARLPSELAKGEVVMILNLRPPSVAALNAAVEDMESRFSEDQQQQLVDIIADVLGGSGGGGGEDDAAADSSAVGEGGRGLGVNGSVDTTLPLLEGGAAAAP